MCNQEEENNFFKFDKKSEINKIGTTCKKCGERKGVVVLRVKDIYCSSCFLAYFVHKFRACLGKAKVMKPGDRVLVSYSGGQSSTAMVHLIKQALEEDNKKKLKYSPFILYVDEGAILNQTLEERNDLTNQILNSVAWTGFPVYVTTLEMVFKMNTIEETENNLFIDQIDGKVCYPLEIAEEQKLKDLYISLSSLTAKEDLLEKLRNRLICRIAEKLKCNKIFSGESGSLLSVRLLSHIAQGRGAHLKADTGFSHHPGEKQILILRPMRELLAKEIAIYNNINKICSFTMPTIGTMTDPRKSISRLTEQFINELQENFPGTVSTIFRTGDKLDCNQSPVSSDNCSFCEGCLDTNSSTDSALFSQLQSQLKLNLLKEKQSANGSGGIDRFPNEKNRVNNILEDDLSLKYDEKNSVAQDQCSKKECFCINKLPHLDLDINDRLSKDELSLSLCYGCRVTLRDCKDLNSLPENIKAAAKKQIRRDQMREEISEFLL